MFVLNYLAPVRESMSIFSYAAHSVTMQLWVKHISITLKVWALRPLATHNFAF